MLLLHLPLLTVLAMIPTLVECQQPTAAETRENYVPYPSDASSLLAQEVQDVGSPLSLEVVTSLATSSSEATWDLFKGIVHRLHNQNQIIHASPHFYISNGLDLGCRLLEIDQDTGFESDIEVLPVPPQCLGACTNHGRYCVVQEESFDPTADNQRGALLVEETLRRHCMVEIYHGSDLKFWEYMEAFERLECRKATDMNACARRAVDVVPHIDYGPIDDCMHLAGGLQQDQVNVRLKQEMDKSHGNQHYVLTDLPLIRLAGKKLPHSMTLDVPHIFEFICFVFQEEKGLMPLACDFCGSCSEVRSCLWELQCDGTPFDPLEFQQPSPTTTTTATHAAAQPTFAPTAQIPMETTSAPTLIQSPAPVPTTSALVNQTELPSASPTIEYVSQSPSPAPSTTLQEEEEQPISSLPSSQQGNTTTALGATYHKDKNDSTYSNQEEEREDDYSHEGHPFLLYGIPAILVAAGILSIYFLASYLRQRYHDQQVNSAEEYFNDLMNESYRDNMAVSGRIEDEASDRLDEDVGTEAPPFASFKVHMVMS